MNADEYRYLGLVQHLPTSDELPDSDDTPVDNEIQNLIPNLLLAVLALVWRDRQDWFLGVDMGIYYLYEQAELQLNQERQQVQQSQRQAIAQLLSLGLSVEQIAGALGLSVQEVKQAIDD